MPSTPAISSKAASIASGKLQVSFEGYQPRTFAVKLAAAKSHLAAPASHSVLLPYDVAVSTHDGKPAEGCFDCMLNSQDAQQGDALPAEMLPADITFAGIHFHLAPSGTGNPDAVAARGQTINLPAGKFTRVYLLAASAEHAGFQDRGTYGNGDITAAFKIGDQSTNINIQRWTGFIGQWDNRGWEAKQIPIDRPADAPPLPADAPTTRTEMFFDGKITPGYIKRADVAWFSSHIHDDAAANQPYQYSYLFAYALDVPAGAKTLSLPNDERIRILAVTVADESPAVRPAQPLYDTLRH
jgi:alpha-mannosidase